MQPANQNGHDGDEPAAVTEASVGAAVAAKAREAPVMDKDIPNGESKVPIIPAPTVLVRDSSLAAVSEGRLSPRGLAVVKAATAAGFRRSDSVLSEDEDDEDYEQHTVEQEAETRRKDRALSFVYMEEASMEAVQQEYPSVDRTVSGESGGSGRSLTKLSPSGRLGRRRTETSESDIIVVADQDLEGYNTRNLLPEEEDVQPLSLRSTVSGGMDKSETDIFRSLPAGAFQPTLDAALTAEPLETTAAPISNLPDQVSLSPLTTPPPVHSVSSESVRQVLESYSILPSENNNHGGKSRISLQVDENNPTADLHSLFEGFCLPSLEMRGVQAALHLELQQVYSTESSTSLPDQPAVAMNQPDNRVVSLLTAGTAAKPALLQLPVDFAAAFLRLLVRLLTHESDQEYNEACLLILSWKNPDPAPINLSEEPPADPDHATRRPHLLYSMIRFQCSEQWSLSTAAPGDDRSAVTAILALWERVVEQKNCGRLIAPVARLLGLLSTAGLTPRILRRMLTLAQSPSLSPYARLCMVRAMKTAAAGSSRPAIMHKTAPRHFFSFGGQGLKRSISGLATWPFRNDFGMAVWFRAERFDASSKPILLSARSDDGGGVEVSLVPLGNKSSDACTVAVSVFNSGHDKRPVHLLKVSGCVLLPRVWYHLAIRHTRSRLKGVFSLSTRQHLSIMLDGKVMLTESLPFPKVSDADFKDDSATSSLLQTSLRRNPSQTRMNLSLEFCTGFDGQTGALYLLNDNISDASLRALFETTGGKDGIIKRNSSLGDAWDARQSDIVRKSRILDVNITNDDADEIVLSQRRRSGSRKRTLDEDLGSVVDLAEGGEQDVNDVPAELQKASFGSKVFLVWDPRRTLDSLALELHVGAHVNMEAVYTWRVNGMQDVIRSTGGIQALIPLFRSLLVGEIEKILPTAVDCDPEAVLATTPDLVLLLASFVQDHSENARELLRCGGVDVIEQLLFTNKRSFMAKPQQASFFGSLNSHVGLAYHLLRALLKLRSGSAHYVGLETKIFSRLLFNIPLWLGLPSQVPGLALHVAMLPLLSTLTRIKAEKVRDCVGANGMINALKEYSSMSGSLAHLDRFETRKKHSESRDVPFTVAECRHGTDILLGMIFEVLASGTSPADLAPFLHFVAFNLDVEFDEATEEVANLSALSERRKERLHLTTKACTVLLFLLQIRPPVPGLFESFAHCCGSVQGGVGWILSAMVNTYDDGIRSLGIRCVSAYLDVASKSPDTPLSLGAPLPSTEVEVPSATDVTSSVRRASTRFPLIAKGLAAMGPGVRAIVVTPSKLTARVVFKLLWHLLKSHRMRLGDRTRAALLHCITNDNGIVSSFLSSGDFVLSHLVGPDAADQSGFKLQVDWAESVLAENGNIVGRSLRNPLAIGTVLRLLQFLESSVKDRWVSDLLALSTSSRKSISLLSSIPDWQPSLFRLVSETLEQVVSCRDSHFDPESKPFDSKEAVGVFETDGTTVDAGKDVRDESKPLSSDSQLENPASVAKRLDLCLELYSNLLGHLVREGGDKALEAVEDAASLQRVCLNGHDVLLLILSSLCANLFDHGTLLEMGAISAQDWKDIDLDQDSLPLKQSARLVTDSILSNGTKGLDMTAAVRSWRSLRHLTEVIVAVVTKSGLGVVDLFDYINQQASAVDSVSGGLHGIRLSDFRLSGVRTSEYVFFSGAAASSRSSETDVGREVDRRLCVMIAAQVLTLLDAFIFPDSLDSSLPASQLHGLALVRNSEPRLGSSQGPLISSAIRLSLLLLALLEPCSVRFLQCASRLRCLLYWALELLQELVELGEGSAAGVQHGAAALDRLVLAIVLHCHRALGRCSALLSEIESSHEKYFPSRDSQKKHFRRLVRVATELRDIISTVFRRRNDFLRSTLSEEAFESLRVSLEGLSSSSKSVVRDFMSSSWVTGFQDVETRVDLAIPEQVATDTIPLSSAQGNDPSIQGFLAVERLANESSLIVKDFEKALDGRFEGYLEGQRKWAETDAVRDLESDGDTIVKRLSEKHRSDANEMAKNIVLRRSGAESRWRVIQRSTIEPWKSQAHWKLARYTDLLGRRTVLVQNKHYDDHKEASYEHIREKEREKQEREREARLLKKKDLSDVMRRNAEAFIVNDSTDSAEESDTPDDDSSMFQASDEESSTDLESATDGEDSIDPSANAKTKGLDHLDEAEQDEEWDKIGSEEIENVDAEGDADSWAKTFIWSDGESVVARFEHVMIVTLQTFVEGKLLLTTHGLYFRQMGDEINVMTREPVDNPDNSEDRRWRLTRLTEIHGRRFMLRPQALELFFSDSHELFLNFPVGNKERDRFHAKLRNSCKVPMLWSPKSLNPRVVFRKSRLTELWRKRKISNFQYLMALNRMAGRSFNDMTQYPVFPWILADYTSNTIDLSDSRVYRDLTKPVGALNPNRLAQLLERYNELESFGFTEAEKFLYGSHYSSPGIILHYLIRQEPFTTMAIELQSGRFDCPDRLFFDIGSSWKGCMTSSSDMKELIPEFFSLPEMFTNNNEFPLGHTQSGRLIDNVGLPPWAKGSAYEFVRMHRLALESEYVSQNLQHWVDLIFGYKQRGPESEAAHNIFHHLSYEGSVDLDKIADEIDRNAAESHIQNFGQTPSQLAVTDPHPARYAVEECWKPLIYDTSVPKSLRCYTASKQFGNKRSEYGKGSVLKVHVLSDTILAVYADMSVGNYRWFPNSKNNRLRMDRLRPIARRELSMSRAAMKRGSAIPPEQMDKSSISIGNWSFACTIGGMAKEELRRKAVLPPNRLITGSEITLAASEASALLVSCGYWDGTLKVHSTDSWRVIASETGGHNGPIRCLAMGQDGGLLITGGQDGTCRVWVVDHPDMAIALSDGYVQTALGASNDGEQLLSCCHVLWGHESPISCVVLNSDLDVTVSGSQSGLVCVHTIRRGEFIRSFRPPALSNRSSSPPPVASKLALDTTGTLVVSMQDAGLHSYTVNGVRLCTVDAGEHLYDMKICSNGEMLVTGGDRCQVLIRSTVDLSVCAMLDLTRHGPIRCLSLTPEDLNPVPQFLFIGSEDGMITVVDQDPLIQHKDTETTSF